MTTSTDANSIFNPEMLNWKSTGEFISVNGYQIFVREEGSHELPVLLLIHGFPTASWDWHLVWEQLKKDYRLIAMDMLGFGFSDKPNMSTYSIHLQADIVEAVVKSKSITEFHVLAHDYGDTVAQELLARQTEGTGVGHWLSCCFLNGGLFPETHRALLTQKLLLSPIGPLLNKLAGFGKFKSSFSAVFGQSTKPTLDQLKEFWALINYKGGKHIFHNLITYMRDRKVHRERWVSVLQQAQIPLSLINGSVDPVSGAHMVARYQQLECRLDYLGVLAEVGHYPQVEDPHGVVQHYIQFQQSMNEKQKQTLSATATD